MKNKQAKVGVLIGLTAIITLMAGGVVHANPSEASASCQGGINYAGYDYPASGNTVTVYIDGVVVVGYPKAFGPAIEGHVPFTSQSVPHTWSVVWDRYNGTNGDRTQSGRVEACVVPTTTTVIETTTTVPATTTIPAEQTTTTVVAETTTPVVEEAPTTVVVTDLVVLTTATTIQPELPVTGLDIDAPLMGLILIAAGLLCCVIAIRRLR